MKTDTLIAALHAAGPHPDFVDKLMLFGQFVGSWEIEIVDLTADEQTELPRGELHFGWALGGRAVMDVWSAPLRCASEAGGVPLSGVTVRFYDPEIDAWRSTWIAPPSSSVMPFIGRQISNEIVLEGTFQDGALTHWVFSEITPMSFLWRAEESHDGGATWQRLEEIRARRTG